MMNELLQFAILGIGAGALYAALAQGLILAHRGAGVINIAHGAMAMYVAYAYYGFRNGVLAIPPLPNPLALIEGVGSWFGADLDLASIPATLTFAPMSALPAFVWAMLVAVLLGSAVHYLAFRPLRKAPPLAKTVASVGVALVLQAIVALRFGTESVVVDRLFPSGTARLGDALVPYDRIYLLGFVILISGGLLLLFRYTRIGLSTRAAAENEVAAVLIGLSPTKLAHFSWISSSVIAGSVGILFSTVTGLNPVDYVLYVIPALGAALLARLNSFSVAAAAGLLIGALQSITLPLQSRFDWFPDAGAAAGIPLIVIVIAMIVRGDALPQRGTATEIRLPRFPDVQHAWRLFAPLLALVIAGLLWLPFDLRGSLVNSLAGVVLALSLVVIVGMAGQISLMQVALAAAAAIAVVRFAGDLGLPFLLAAPLAVLVAAATGVLAGLPAMRVRGVHLAVLTLAAAYAFQHMVVASGDIVRTTDASGALPAPSLFGLDLGINSDFPIGSGGPPSPWFGLLELVVVIGAIWLVMRLRRSSLGLRFLAVRGNEKAASALGLSVPRTKLAAFAIGAALAGAAGVLSAYRFEGLTPSEYGAMASIMALALAYLGGVTQVWGAMWSGALAAGGVAFVLLDRLVHMGQYQPLIAGAGLVLTAILNPEGIAGAIRFMRDLLRHRLRRDDDEQQDGSASSTDRPPAATGDEAAAALRREPIGDTAST